MLFGNISLIVMYLMSIVLANLLVAEFGPWMVPINAFLFIGLDLTARDRLHDAWHGRHLAIKMGLLILAGSLITMAVNWGAARIAVASFLAFGAAAIMDAIAYQFLRSRRWMVRANGSNVMGAVMDSIIFPTVAFGAFLPWVILGQIAAKIGGGFVWSIILRGDPKNEQQQRL